VIRGVAEGERWAADALCDRVQPTIARTLRKILRDSSLEYEDLVQATFERIVRTIAEDRFAQACSLTTWASAIAAHVALDSLRGRIRERRVFDRGGKTENVEMREGPKLERLLEARRQIDDIQRALARMKPDQARAVMLHDVLGHPLEEIAVMTRASVSAAQSRLVRGRKELLKRVRPGAEEKRS
jgi:RNA polymerase sigma-70 factor (ECF subfamily)